MPKKTEVKLPAPVAPVQPVVQPLTQEFTSISEMNILRDKINEIIKQL